MAITVDVTRNGLPDSVLNGLNTNVIDYSVQEDATTVDISNFNGGFGQISVQANSVKNSLYGVTDMLRLSDDVLGKTQGIVREVEESDGGLSLIADSALGVFDADKVVNPQTGTLLQAMTYYCNLAGVTNVLKVDPSIASRSVAFPGWSGNMWDNLKQILAAQQTEMSLVFEDVVVRPLRTIVANITRTTSITKRVNNQDTSREIEVYYYNHEKVTNREIYPWNLEDPNVYSVDAGQTVTLRLEINGSLSSVNQPTCVSFVPNSETLTSSGVYSVAGNDGLPITPSQWGAQGGNLTVRIVEPNILEVTIVGASMPTYAPFRIAMTAGTSSYYNSLRITGTGLRWNKKSVKITTGSTAAVTGEAVGVTVDSPYIDTYGDALNVGLVAAGKNSMTYTMSGTAFNINRTDGGTEQVYARISDFNTAVAAGTTIGAFNTTWNGQSIAQFNAYWSALVDNMFENQAFGNAAGARILTADANFRITSATITPTGLDFNADLDTTIADYNTAWSGKLVSDFNTAYVGRTCMDYSITPLRTAR